MLKVTQAPDPGDVKWLNIIYSTKKKFLIRFFTIFLTLGILLGFFFLILYINQLQQGLRNSY